MFRVKDVMETDGAYDPNKEIDIMSYSDSGQVRNTGMQSWYTDWKT